MLHLLPWQRQNTLSLSLSRGLLRTIILVLFLVIATVHAQRQDDASPNGNRNYRNGGRGRTCSKFCPCLGERLRCSHSGFTRIPFDLSKRVDTIEFNHNRVAELDGETFAPFRQLRRLKMAVNRISIVTADAFAQQTKLEFIDLSGNAISSLPSTVFNLTARRLIHLALSKNKLTKVPKAIRSLRKLQTLYLMGNEITKLKRDTFVSNTQLRHLDLSYNKIKSLTPGLFAEHRHLLRLTLSANPLGRSVLGDPTANLTALSPLENSTTTPPPFDYAVAPLRTKSPINVLHLKECSLTAVPAHLPKTITVLDLSWNNITRVKRREFVKNTKLKTVDLSHNSVIELDPKAFKNSARLTMLKLNHNNLRSVPGFLPRALEVLDLNHNWISDVPRNALGRAPTLYTVHLHNNHIEYISPRAFANASRLDTLTLYSNNLNVLASGVFSGLTALRTLDLSKNPLRLLEPDCFRGLVNLDSLKMTNTPSKIDIQAPLFFDTHRIRILDLDSSEAVVKAMLVFDVPQSYLRYVRYLNMMRANVERLPPTFPQFMVGLEVILMADNPWRCERDLQWLQRWALESRVSVASSASLYCSSPPQVKGQRLLYLRDHEWRYSN